MKGGFVCFLSVLIPFSLCLADPVTEWNSAALRAIRIDRTPPPKASRALAILHLAIYDSVNGIKRTHEPYMVGGQVPASASVEAAVAAAAHSVLANLFPAQQPAIDAAYQSALATLADHPQKDAGLIWGEYVASQILADRAADGYSVTVPVPEGGTPGLWVPTPPAYAAYLLPQWAFLRPFVMNSCSQFRPPPPPALTSPKYTADYNEVKQLGAAVGSSRTPEQTQIALFWADGAGTETPPGHWNHIAQQVAAARGNSLEQNARLFALLNIAMADAAICAWDGKYYYHDWRPVTAIRNGDLDGNPDTALDLSWSSLIVTPPFPNHISGHSTFSAAASVVLALYFGSDNIPFTTGSDFLSGVYRSFNSFSAAAAEAAISRLYGGIHFRSANEDGLQSGLKLGQFVMERSLVPRNDRARIK